MKTSHDQDLLKARRYLQSSRVEEAKAVLTVLANQNHAPAMFDLAHVLLIENHDTDPDGQAMAWLYRAESLAYAPAIYQLAVFSLSNALVKTDWQQLSERLSTCCSLGHPEALCDAALLLARIGSDDQKRAGTELLESAAVNGSLVAMALLGERLANGLHCNADPARANSIRRLAKELEMPVAPVNPLFGFARPEPAITPPLPIALQFPDLQDFVEPPASHVLDERINLKIAEHALSPEECLYIRCLGGPQVKPSISVDPNGQQHQNRIRTSYDFLFLPQSETISLKLLQMRMAAVAGLPLHNAEAMVLLRYMPGQEYFSHRDYLPPSHFTAVKSGGSGQRVRTVIAYLNTPESGGNTVFPLLAKDVSAECGRMVCFDNIQANGQLHELSLHAGTPVKQGVKWICTLWIREQCHRLF